MQRRKFLQTSAIFAAGFYASRFPAIAGPFRPGELTDQIPLDKKLDPKWIKSLYKRGAVTKYLKSKNELQYIGMPVGGICCGTVYLGGDGRLWLWDIFNANQFGIEPMDIDWKTDILGGRKLKPSHGSAYVLPAKNIRPVEQGFAFKISMGDKVVIKKLEASDWDDIIFEAAYPMGKIHYIDKALPVEITAEVYSPFIPLDEKNSGLPATIYTFHFKNKSAQPLQIDVIGWLENTIALRTAKPADIRYNEIISTESFAAVQNNIKDNGQKEQGIQADYGTMGIAAFDVKGRVQTDFELPLQETSFNKVSTDKSEKPAGSRQLSSVATHLDVYPKSEVSSSFAISWYFPNLKVNAAINDGGRYYTNFFGSAADVLQYVHHHFDLLSTQTRLWKDTWYDSSLPWWFLERTLVNISCLATTTSHRLKSGRFYAYEGVGCCEGTCTHVWQYAQAMARIFPAVEKDVRQRVDLGLSLQPDGMIWFRGEVAKAPAIDGQAGTILRIYREHQMSSDNNFLKNNWEKIKRATQYVINQDRNRDGMEDTPLENTLDAVWDGEIAWLVGLCIAAVKAAELMAVEMNDESFAKACATYVAKGKMNMEEKLYNGEYFIHRPDAEKGRKKLGSYNTCHIDQVYGQAWAHQVGMERVLDRDKTVSALRALWKYNFTPDVGPYIKEHTGGRPYAIAGEGGMIMNTNPKNEPNPYGEVMTWQLGYFHECMTGFEHQVAAHMMAEGMIDESLILTRMIHDRYHAAKRNPFNEIECSDHYARAMSSYGTFLMACGFEYHGPRGFIRFAPKIGANNFKAPFTTAEGWGSFTQRATKRYVKGELQLKSGQLRLNSFGLNASHRMKRLSVMVDGSPVTATWKQSGDQCLVEFESPVMLTANQKLKIRFS